jgi:hypothetical protein
MTAGDPSGEFGGVTPVVKQGNDEKSPCLVLSGPEQTREALTAAAISLEYGRIRGPGDARRAARYAASVTDNSRRLAGGDAALHLRLLVSHRDWLRTLPVGSDELR